jgi:hypothetical protein
MTSVKGMYNLIDFADTAPFLVNTTTAQVISRFWTPHFGGNDGSEGG